MSIERPLIISSKSDLPSGYEMVEAFGSAIRELFSIENPALGKDPSPSKKTIERFKKKLNIKEIWIIFPWRKTVVHTVAEEWYFKLRTSRNRDLINPKEQLNYRQKVIGIAGLSVGSAILNALVISGGPKAIKIADPDTIEITNLNRIKAKLYDVNQNKTTVSAREVWSLDPFADLHLWPKGLSEKNIKEFLAGKPGLDIFIDEMDNLYLKMSSRLICRKLRIPVLMATDIGDRVMLDVERYDLEPQRPLFHGFIGKVNPASYRKLNYKVWLKLSTKIIGSRYLPVRLRQSLLGVGKSISAVPQLGTTATMAGAAMAYVVRQIANQLPMPSGRYIVDLDKALSFKKSI